MADDAVELVRLRNDFYRDNHRKVMMALLIAIATVIFCYNKKAGILFFAGSFLISISRIFVGLHWLSDVLGGFLIGIISGLIITFLFPKVFPNLQKRLQQLK